MQSYSTALLAPFPREDESYGWWEEPLIADGATPGSDVHAHTHDE